MKIASKHLEVSVWRGDGESGDFEDFQVPVQENQTILDVVSWIQQNEDATLSYRYACRVGMCGSCAMMVNGVPRWTCRTHVNKALKENRLEIAPLRNLPVIKDLATDMDVFFEKWIKAEGVHHPSKTRDDPMEPITTGSDARAKANSAIECINCSICYAACDTVLGNPDYLGPAALQRAWTVFHDAKDAGKRAVLAAVSVSAGCHNCHTQGSCTLFCPNDLDPMRAIAGLKRATVAAAFRQEVK
ncbi:MAG: succinate dehydrogenase/fumarate reductase iron-sulfur subunit [Rhodobacteraceae bacterium]|nr:succinate dehydrogenase/fumarate reductase iron-sulfur subunit [Paracoccaceae bacterium]